MIGRPSKEAMVRENGRIIFGVLRQLDCQESELSTEEQSFISEYIEFTRYRKSKESRNAADFRYQEDDKPETDESLYAKPLNQPG